jgi:hypothetical protein
VPYAQTSAEVAAPTPVLPVLSAVTEPDSDSSATRANPAESVAAQSVPGAVTMLPMVVDFPFFHLNVADVGWSEWNGAIREVESLVLLVPLPPVFPLQLESLVLVTPLDVFAVPDNLVQWIPDAAAAAGFTATAVIPASGIKTADIATAPRTIRFSITFLNLLWDGGFSVVDAQRIRALPPRTAWPFSALPSAPAWIPSVRRCCSCRSDHRQAGTIAREGPVCTDCEKNPRVVRSV